MDYFTNYSFCLQFTEANNKLIALNLKIKCDQKCYFSTTSEL